jgi:hypothetical protein
MDLVYIPCKLEAWFDTPAIVIDADGREHRVLASRMDIVDGVVCLVALRLERQGDLHRVRFRDQSECWVKPSPVWDHIPFGADPINVRDLLRALAIRPTHVVAA